MSKMEIYIYAFSFQKPFDFMFVNSGLLCECKSGADSLLLITAVGYICYSSFFLWQPLCMCDVSMYSVLTRVSAPWVDKYFLAFT